MTHARRHALNRPPQLSRKRRLAVYGIGLAVWLSGAVWVLFHYFLMQEGQFGPQPHPVEFWSLTAHGAFAFASLWLFGVLWAVHIPIAWRLRRRRWSGGVMFTLMAWLILSGFLIYYVGNEALSSLVAVLHWAIGLAAPALFLVHRFAREKNHPATARAEQPPLRSVS